MKPLFVVFEGLDGSGTSTQARLLASALTKITGLGAKLTSEPSAGPVGQMIRSAMAGRLRLSAEKSNFDRQMAYLFAADRNDHLYNDVDGVEKSLSEGKFVVSTRYFFSSFAYHCNHAEDWELVRLLNCRFPNPAITIYLDVPVEISLQRLSARSHLDAYENAAKLTAAKNNYAAFFSAYEGELLWLDGQNPEADIHDTVLRRVIETASEI